MHASKSSTMPAATSTAWVFVLEDTTARRRPAAPVARRYLREPGNTVTPASRRRRRTIPFLRFPRPCTVSASGLIIGVSLWQRDAPRLEERSGSVRPRFPVHVCVVVGYPLKGLEEFTSPLRPLSQISVEHLLPRGGVYRSCLREDTIEIE